MSPAYTPQERRQLARAFKAAKPRLDRTKFLCIALIYAGGEHPDLTDLAQAEVMRRIRPHYHVGRWLTAQGYRKADDADGAELLAYRHRWLDSLIAEFSTP